SAQGDGVIFHAGTKRDMQGAVVSAGGRILSAGALGTDIGAARRKAYAILDRIEMDGKYSRKDIGLDLCK
ncbi:MAG: phosphoribosylamine--glycine ligase, partial [Bacteroidales bacterium]|nr:phosphoribosylamine--glycine ligase [Bacteroidales bacterium]